MPRCRPLLLYGAVPLLALTLGGGWYWMTLPPPTETAPPSPAETATGQETLADRWRPPAQPADAPETTATGDTNPVSKQSGDGEPFDLERLQQALSRIAIDDNGELVLDEVALMSLERAFTELGTNPDADSLGRLQLYVEAGLAGDTGRQAARIVGDYFRYRRAEGDFEATQASNGEDSELTPRQRLEALTELRRKHLGPDVANRLYGGQEAHERYLLALEAVNTDSELSPARKREERAALREDLQDGTFFVDDRDTDVVAGLEADTRRWQQQGLSEQTRHYLRQQTLGLASSRQLATNAQQRQDWQQRYNRFERDRQRILEAGLTEAEKQAQIGDLLGRHFSDAEIEASEAFIPEHLRTELETPAP